LWFSNYCMDVRPNITGGLIAGLNQGNGTDGCFSTNSAMQGTSRYGGGSFNSLRREFYANLSSSVYGATSVVQPAALATLALIKT